MSYKRGFKRILFILTFMILLISLISLFGCNQNAVEQMETQADVDSIDLEEDSEETESSLTAADIAKLKGIKSVPEECNDRDDDLDGEIDEELTRECGNLSVGACSTGTQYCASGLWSNCEGEITPVLESCSNKIDDDCDGEIDEGCLCVVSFRNNYGKSNHMVHDFLIKLKANKYSDMVLKEYVVTEKDNVELLETYKTKHGINFDFLPLTFVGDKYVKGFGSEQISGKEILDLISTCDDCGCSE
ncbi:hypothetical protein HN587_03755 [Candidatus Woesearchaeota archaeon]|jgi:hypothetical protein|nr:hypothetical protein [Candidatus Woesearchaeota archaeon]